MIKFETVQTIERSADDVWAYAADIRRHPEWMGVTDARIVQGSGAEVGARAIELAEVRQAALTSEPLQGLLGA